MTVELTEPILGLTVSTYELTAEEIASGEYVIPEVDTGNIYMAHMAEYDAKNYAFPEDLQLHVTVRYNSAEGEQVLEYNVQDTPEQGWGLQYWADSEEKFDFTYPGYFRFTPYTEGQTPVTLVVDSPEQAAYSAERIVLSVSLSIGGQAVSPEDCEIREEEGFDRLYLKRPGWAPEHGTIHLKVVQQLSGGTVWTTERDEEY